MSVDVRVVAATNRDLRQAVDGRTFREDLFFRLSVFPVEIPPLRRRRGDILLLAEAFLERFARELGRRGLRLSEATRRALLDHSWPGNIRELQNCLERAAILCEAARSVRSTCGLSRAPAGAAIGDVVDLTGHARCGRASAPRAGRTRGHPAGAGRGRGSPAAAAALGISLNALHRRLKSSNGTH